MSFGLGWAPLSTFAAFFGIKFLGYTWVCRRIKGAVFKLKKTDKPNIWIFGLARTALGIAIAAVYFYAFTQSDPDSSPWYYYAALLPIRVIEWGVVLVLFFRKFERRSQVPRALLIGFGASVVLDLVAISYALLVPGAVSL